MRSVTTTFTGFAGALAGLLLFAGAAPAQPAPGCNLTLSKHYNGSPTPGSPVQYRLLWCDPCKDALNARIVDELPPGLELVSVEAPTASVAVDGNVVTMSHGEPVSGADLFTIHARVRPDVVPGTEICNSANVTDAFGREEFSSDCFVVGENRIEPELSQRLELEGHLKSRPGRQLTYTARYFRVTPENTLTLTLPERARIIRIHYPKPAKVEGNVLTWKDVPASSGKVRLTYQIDFDLPDGEILESYAVLDDSIGIEKKSHFTTVVRQASAGDNSVQTPPVDFTISGVGYIRAGGVSSLRIGYRNVKLPAKLTITLPPGLSASSAFPAATITNGQVVFDLTSTSGTAKVDVTASPDAVSGTTLTTQGRIFGPDVDAVSRWSMKVR